jgi:hypothetical protein
MLYVLFAPRQHEPPTDEKIVVAIVLVRHDASMDLFYASRARVDVIGVDIVSIELLVLSSNRVNGTFSKIQ